MFVSLQMLKLYIIKEAFNTTGICYLLVKDLNIKRKIVSQIANQQHLTKSNYKAIFLDWNHLNKKSPTN